MKRFGAVIVGALLGMTCWPQSAGARECAQSAASFRADFEAYIADVESLAFAVDSKKLPVQVQLGALADEARWAARDLTAEQEDALCQFFERHAGARKAPAELIEKVQSIPETLERPGGSLARRSASGSGPQCLQEDIRRAAEATNKVADLAGIVAQAVCDAAPSGDLVVLNTVLCPIAGVSKGVAKVAEFVTKVDDVCKLFEQTFKLEDLRSVVDSRFDELEPRFDHLDRGIAPLAQQTSVDGLSVEVRGIDSDIQELDAKLDQVRLTLDDDDVDRGEFEDLSFRIQIEELLGSDLNSRISLFQLPESVGGRLEYVREIVADTILMNEDAGQDTGQALEFFAEADSHFNSQRFSQAFAAYREAYREASQAEMRSMMRPERGDR